MLLSSVVPGINPTQVGLRACPRAEHTTENTHTCVLYSCTARHLIGVPACMLNTWVLSQSDTVQHRLTQMEALRIRCCFSSIQVAVPDVHPGDLVQRPGLLSMCAGDFVEVYGQPNQAGSFDCVATCFFLDTAHNILQYMQIIKHILKVRHNRHNSSLKLDGTVQ